MEKDNLSAFMEHHRFYSNRLWQYFGAILIVNTIIISALKDIGNDKDLMQVLAFMSVGLIGVFYHLMNWTDMRIEQNIIRINSILKENPMLEATNPIENSINWIKFAILLLAAPYSYLVIKYCDKSMLRICILIFFILLVVISEYTRRKFQKKNKMV